MKKFCLLVSKLLWTTTQFFFDFLKNSEKTWKFIELLFWSDSSL